MGKNANGFTLIELMVVLAMVLIFAAVAIPSWDSFIKNDRFTSASGQLYNAYRYARNEAIKTASPVTLQARSGSWANGWQVVNADGVSLFESSTPHEQITITGNDLTVQNTGALAASTSFTISGMGKVRHLCVLASGQSQLKNEVCS